MNKLFTKVAALSVGLAMAVGVGVAVGGRSAKVAKAASVVFDSCDLSAKTASCTGYSKEHAYGDYIVYGGQNNGASWEYFKFGAKKSKASDPDKVTEGYIKSTKAMSEKITSVEIVILANSASCEVTWDVEVASDADFTSIVDTTATTALSGASDNTVSAVPTSGSSWDSSKYYRVNLHITNKSTTNGCFTVQKVNFYYESSTPRGEIEIDEFASPVISTNSAGSLSYTWTPAAGSSATISSHTWTSSDSEVLSISGDNYTPVAPGIVTLTLNATDSNGQQYSVQSNKLFVTNGYSFATGDNVAIYTSGASKELSGISTTTTHYGLGESYSEEPVGVFALTVEEGAASGSYSFVHEEKYLSWSSGNSLDTNATKSLNSSWYVIAREDRVSLINAATTTREIWWNNGSTGLRFACYERSEPDNTYFGTSLKVITEVPVRGTVEITNPTGTLMKEGAQGIASYSWTPAEGSSATITSHSWASSNPEVISVSGDSFTAQSAGKAKLTLSATDSSGQNYVVSTSDITVVDVVSGSYEKKYSVAEGDTIAIVCETAETQMSGISNKIGTYVFYNEAPASVYDFVLEEGNAENSFALKNGEDKYLSWTSGTDIALVDEVNDNSSWTISFDENGNATIANVALDGDTHRNIAWNNNSPRFTTYKGGQTAVQLYGPAIEIDPSAVSFAQRVINDLTCDATGKTAPSVSQWGELETAYASVSETGKGQLVSIKAVHHEDPSTDREYVEEALAKYDYVVGKYGSDRYADFINRDPAPVAGGMYYDLSVESNSNAMTIIIITVSAISVLAFTSLLVFKKKKQ